MNNGILTPSEVCYGVEGATCASDDHRSHAVIMIGNVHCRENIADHHCTGRRQSLCSICSIEQRCGNRDGHVQDVLRRALAHGVEAQADGAAAVKAAAQHEIQRVAAG
jgi:hypothetical protein